MFNSESLPQKQNGGILNTVCQLPGFLQFKSRVGKLDTADDSREELLEIAEHYLKTRIEEGDIQSHFILGQLCFEEGWYEDALLQFEKVKDEDYQALYQAGVIYYDGLGIQEDVEKGVEYMKQIIATNNPKAQHLKYAAAYNLGQACFEGKGLPHSDKEAEMWWLLAADNGNPKASVKAQSTLGMFYSRPPNVNLKKAFFWHAEACGNGSLESQGVLGVMYLKGQGIRKDLQSAMECLKAASERGNLYAQGNLVGYYYQRKLYTMAVELAKK
ncbi:LRP2-binding protein [Rhinophrynus dorsalis]